MLVSSDFCIVRRISEHRELTLNQGNARNLTKKINILAKGLKIINVYGLYKNAYFIMKFQFALLTVIVKII